MFFFRFWLDFGSPGALKSLKKIEKIGFLTRSVLKEGSGRAPGRFWKDFDGVLKGF